MSSIFAILLNLLPKAWKFQLVHLTLRNLGINRDLYYNLEKKVPPSEQDELLAKLIADTEVSKTSMLKSDRLLGILETIKSLPQNPVIFEVGAYKGGTSLFILEACKYLQKKPELYVFDTFEGHVTKHENDPLHQAGSGQFKDTSFTSVKKLLSEFEGVQVIKGDATKTVEGIFEEVPRGLDFLHLDTDVYPVTLSVLEVVLPKLKTGGVVIIDDYGTRTCPGVFKAVNEFLHHQDSASLFALSSIANQKYIVKTGRD